MGGIGVSHQKDEQSVTDVMDRNKALSRVDGDVVLMANLVNIFLTESGPMMEKIRAAVTNSDSEKLEKAAHLLKGSASIFCAKAVGQAAVELEKIGRSGDLTNAAEIFGQLEQQMASLLLALKQFLTELH